MNLESGVPSENIDVSPFRLSIAQSVLSDLQTRLSNTRWPEPETVSDGSQGVPWKKMKALGDYWIHRYDWRRCEQMLNAFNQSRTTIDGVSIHFLHIRSRESEARPLLLTHGWPGSVLEFYKVVGPLTDPMPNGGEARDAFHLVIPSLPGFGFSNKPAETGWGFERVADAWITLMARLGYDQWLAQGGDLGSGVTEAIGRKRPAGCMGIHLNMSFFQPTPEEVRAATPQELHFLAKARHYFDEMAGYASLQGTRPQTLGYSLADSPAGQAAWTYEKFLECSDPDSERGDAFTMDEILDNVMLYWLPNAGASSARMYWELRHSANTRERLPIEIPTGYSGFPREVIRASKRWLEARFSNLTYFNEPAKGGHFAALEQPQIFVNELRAAFRRMGS